MQFVETQYITAKSPVHWAKDYRLRIRFRRHLSIGSFTLFCCAGHLPVAWLLNASLWAYSCCFDIHSLHVYLPNLLLFLLLLLTVSSSLYVSHMSVTRVLSSLVFQSCPSLELMSPLQVTHLPPVWDLLLPLA